jgi:endonuclease/exonuclease/phosphatase family metal-dependent hydrolase
MELILIGGCQVKEDSIAQIRVATYNIHHGVNQGDIYNLQGIAATLKNLDADIIALQEVDQGWGIRSNYDKQLDILAKELNMYSAFAPALDRKIGQYGLAVLSRFPISNIETKYLSSTLEQRVLLALEVKINDITLNVYNTHLGLSTKDRQAQIKDILNYITMKAKSNLSLLMGDFNVNKGSTELEPISQSFFEVEELSNKDIGETLIDQNLKVDNIYLSTKMPIKALKTFSSSASDHYPVVVDLLILKEK